MALTTYTNLNNNGDPVTMIVIDTGCGTAPVDRASTLTPLGGYTVPTSFAQTNFGAAGADSGVGSAPAKRLQVFEPVSFVATIDPGLGTFG